MNVEIDITLRCNGVCKNCCRHCHMEDLGIDHSDSDMTIDQVKKFVRQVKESSTRIEMITIMGGEPLLHPDLVEIAKIIKNDLFDSQIIDILKIVSNGRMSPSEELLAVGVPVFTWVPHNEKHLVHRCTLVAPRDRGQSLKFCDFPYKYGIGLSTYGYTPCAAGGAIIRLFQMFDLIRYDLPTSPDEWGVEREEICGICQAAAVEPVMEIEHGRPISKSYQQAMDIYRNSSVKLKRF